MKHLVEINNRCSEKQGRRKQLDVKKLKNKLNMKI